MQSLQRAACRRVNQLLLRCKQWHSNRSLWSQTAGCDSGCFRLSVAFFFASLAAYLCTCVLRWRSCSSSCDRSDGVLQQEGKKTGQDRLTQDTVASGQSSEQGPEHHKRTKPWNIETHGPSAHLSVRQQTADQSNRYQRDACRPNEKKTLRGRVVSRASACGAMGSLRMLASSCPRLIGKTLQTRLTALRDVSTLVHLMPGCEL